MLKAFAVIVLSLFTITGAAACEETLSVGRHEAATVTTAASEPTAQFMGDGIAAESAARSAYVDQVFAVAAAEALAGFEADLIVMEPAATGSLALTPWEAEEPRLLEAYFDAREAYEATLTP